MKNRSKSAKGILAQPRLSMVAALVAACIGTEAHALGFGRMKVQSALGQPLRAEVELIDAKSSNLRAGMAAPAVYVQKGLDYGPTVKGIRASVRKMPNGRAVLVLSSDAPINDPFVDVVLQASDGAGSVTRDFSLLLDPPSTPAPVEVVEPATPRASRRAPAAVKPAPRGERMDLPPAEGAEEGEARAPVRKKRAAASSGRTRSGAVRVRQGDTAGQIAARNRPARVSLDQMLVALQRANSHAFINGNVNLLKSGVVLKMPSAAEVRAVPAAEAHAIIVAQSEDFRSYRGQLARAPMTQVVPSAQQSGGKVQSRIEDTKTSPVAAPDTLTISKAEVKANNAPEQRMAEAMQKRDNVNRADELNKNLSDLKNISAEVAASAQPGTPPAVVPPTAGANNASASGVTVPIVAPVETAASQAVDAASEAASAAVTAASDAASAAEQAASEAMDAASEAASEAVAPVKKPVAPPPQPVEVEEPSFFESLTGNPLVLGGAGLAALGGLAYVFMRRRRQNQGEDDGSGSSFYESNYAPDSFFHVSGGKDVDTSEATTATGATSVNQSSMLYSPSQLDADADVDPVAEADVYLAYGRDIQAEEILKDALLKNPNEVSVHAKLLEVYARRRDVKAYSQAATEFKRLTQGQGAEWDIVRAKGAEIDPGNALYAESASGSQGSTVAQTAAVGAAAAVAASAMPAATAAPAPQQPVEAPKSAPAPVQADPEFDLKTLSPATVPAAARASMSNRNSEPPQALDLSLDMDVSEAARPAAPSAEALAPSSQGLEFSMSGLSLDSEQPAEAADAQSSDPLATKLALAREFMGIGDNEGARIMAQEVAQNATGGLKAQAEALLESLR